MNYNIHFNTMKILHIILALTVFTANHGVFAETVGDCAGTPADAIVELPPPLNTWGTIACTPYGHIITNKQGWIWTYPGSYAPVFIPSQMVKNNPIEVGNKSYFTSIKVAKVVGDEFKKAYDAFHSHFAKDKDIPSGYRLDAISISGKALKLYLFDYGNHAWGIWCDESCVPETSFMLIDMAKRPE